MDKPMELNKETALRLWTQQFGNVAKAKDFADREIAKAAYNNRNSRFCWNVDHILPQSRGGKTADYNLICCHMETNDEKASRFPCFTANGLHFQIEKRQNHYEIIRLSDSRDEEEQEDEGINFWDAAQGMHFWKKCRRKSEQLAVGYVKVQLDYPQGSVELSAFQRFLEELFESTEVFFQILETRRNEISWTKILWNEISCPRELCTFTILIDDLPTKEDTENLLDHCIVLNTYREVFEKRYDWRIKMVCGMKIYDSPIEKSAHLRQDILDRQVPFCEDLAIDELIRINTSAWKKVDERYGAEFYPYNMVFTKLQKDLEKYL